MPFNTLKPARKAVLATAGLLLTAALPAYAAWDLNLPRGVTATSREVYDLHMLALWVCTVIGIIVFGAMGYAMFKFRHSKGAVADTKFTHSTKLEIIWTVVPVLILVVMAVPATLKVMEQYEARGDEMTVKVTGYQWM
mgnify:CR=1 FL=1